MSKNDILYVKGMDMSDIECQIDDDENNIWDDTQLTHAYDKALKMANIEVAKRIAMSTNTSNKQKQNAKPAPQRKSKSNRNKGWEVGEPCRAMYEGDGLEYEAFVQRIISDKEYVVKFLGYGNTEIVSIDNMKPSLGKDAQRRQIEQSSDKGEETDNSVLAENMEIGSDRALSPASTERSSHKKDKKKKRQPQPQVVVNGFQLPDMSMPMPMPNFGKIRNFSAMDMPLPQMAPPPLAPPPLAFPCGERVDCEDAAVSSMLLSWYMSGYYTGLYQGLKRSKDLKRRKN